MVYTIGTLKLIAEPGPSGIQALYRDSTPVDLTPKALSLLVLLADHAGELVLRDQIRDAIWPGQYVEETNLTRHVSLIRVCLREHLGEGEHLIRYPKKGYQLTAPVTRTPLESHPSGPRPAVASIQPPPAQETFPAPVVESPTLPAAAPRSPKSVAIFGVAAFLVAIVAVFLLIPRHTPPPPSAVADPQALPAEVPAPLNTVVAATAKSVAIVPPVLTGDTPQRVDRLSGAIQLVEGVSAENGGVATVSSGEVATASHEFNLTKPLDPTQATVLARRLGADLILATNGTVHGQQVQVDLALLDSRSGKPVASKSLQLDGAAFAQSLPLAVADLIASAGVTIDAPSVLSEGLPAKPEMLEDTAEAGAFYQSGEYMQALALLLPTLKRDPASPYLHLLLANTYDAIGEYEKSATEARHALDTSKELKGWYRIAVEARAETLLISWPSAIGAYSRLHKAFPRNVDYALALTEAYEWSEMHATAVKTLESVASLHDPRVDAHFAEMAMANNAWKEALERGREEWRHAHAIGATTLESNANAHICKAQARLGNYDEGLAACDASLKMARSLKDNRAILFALGMQGDALRLAGDDMLASVTVDRMALAEKTGNQTEIFESMIQKGFTAAGQKDFVTAAQQFKKADDLAVRMNNLKLEAESKGMLSYLANITHDDDAMLDYATQDLNIAKATQNKRWEANSLGYIGSAYSDKGEDGKARDYWQQAVVAAKASGDNHALYAMLHHLVSLETRQGHPDVAAKWKTQMDALPEDPVKQRTPHQVNPTTPKPQA